eukprot:CAMPEP_0197076628 /NCGR_PEP_ID=MMETSP1384-20130603/212214_1 /TAXON_ID=29189 /ORGANISM="Ammonia sp." /LENGTH=294 /DNA_ID=CAMNT_0042515487 /DNA_START=71 /DNA_END=955 /DNA_ORIENTATION=-
MGNVNIKTIFMPEEHEPLLTNHACPEMTVNSGYITKSQLILQFNYHSIGDKWSYTIHDYFHNNKRIFDAMHPEQNLLFIADSENHIVAILEREKWNTIVIKNSHKMPVAALVPNRDHFELKRMYKQSGMDADEMEKPYVYSVEGDFEHNHFVIKNDHIVAILEREKWNSIVIKNSHKMPVAALVPNRDHFELKRMYKQSGMDADEMDKPCVYSVEGDLEHNHFVIKNAAQDVISKVSGIYGDQAMDQNFGVRICKNTDVVMVISICMALNMFTNNVDLFTNNMPALTPIGIPYV